MRDGEPTIRGLQGIRPTPHHHLTGFYRWKRESPHQWRAWGSVNQDRAGVTGLPALKSYAIRIYRVTAGFVVSMTFDRSITVTGFGQGLQFADQVVDGHLGISGRAIPSKVNAEFRGS